MKLEERQKLLDEEKWLKSEQEGRDVCGEFEYCKHCDKAHAHPCAAALSKAEKKPAAKKACTKTATKKATETKKAPAKKVATKAKK